MNDFLYVTPPPDGLHHAFASARTRRLRKAGLSTGTAAAAMSVLALLAGSQGTQSLVQQPAPEQPAVSQLVPDDARQVAPRPNQGHAVQVFGTTQRGTPAGRGVMPVSPVTGPVRGTTDRQVLAAPAGAPYRAGSIARTDNDPLPSGDASCAVPTGDVKRATGLCTSAWLGGTSGDQITASICSNSTSLTLLHYRGDNEVDFRITTSKGVEVWRWSRWHPDVSRPHTLGLEARTCTTWTFDWTGVDANGHKLAQGDYTLTATFLPDELAHDRSYQYPFTL